MHFYQSRDNKLVLSEAKWSGKPNLFRVGASVGICYESVFPHIMRGFVQNGARLLFIITNDGWFGNTSGPRQHARYAIFRAIENRVSVARSANTGISLVILPSGRIIRRLGYNRTGTLVADVPVLTKETFYTRHGDWFAYWNMGALVVILIGYAVFQAVQNRLRRDGNSRHEK